MNLKSLLASSIVLLGAFSTAFAEANWLTNFEEAKKVALKEGKPLLLNFTGRNWCPACEALRKDIFSTEEFTKEAASKYVLVELDFPLDSGQQTAELKAQNDELLRKCRVFFYPTILLVDAQTEVVFGRSVGFGDLTPRRFLEGDSGYSFAFRGRTTRQFLDKLAGFKNTPEGKAALVEQEQKEIADRDKVADAKNALRYKLKLARDAGDFEGACKAIDEASTVEKAIASVEIDPAKKTLALNYLDAVIVSDGGANASALKAMREVIADGPAIVPASKPAAEAEDAQGK
jgi:thiol-disulfide isomerase/thioredoxin